MQLFPVPAAIFCAVLVASCPCHAQSCFRTPEQAVLAYANVPQTPSAQADGYRVLQQRGPVLLLQHCAHAGEPWLARVSPAGSPAMRPAAARPVVHAGEAVQVHIRAGLFTGETAGTALGPASLGGRLRVRLVEMLRGGDQAGRIVEAVASGEREVEWAW